ncbi:MAG: nucleotidyltransferase domain-containing protein [Candidatus Rokubacteria bacterium]|nr:nucleotidyltransferase domain-containing protein [Candidatus Rokubacteria bacterium]
MTTDTLKVHLPMETIGEFCRRWKITQLSLFGSALRDDFTERSDLDFLVTFAPGAGWSLLDHVEMEEELAQILSRRVDLLTRRAVERSHNWLRRNEILGSARVVYEAR